MIFFYVVIFLQSAIFYFLVDEELRIVREKIEQDYNDVSMRDLCAERSGSHHVNFFKLEEKFCKMVSGITEIKCSRIFGKLWQKYGEKLQDERVTMEVIFDKIWLRICDKLNSVSQLFLSGDMRLKDIDKYLRMFDTDYEALEKEFVMLLGFLNDKTMPLNQVKDGLRVTIERVKNYKKLFDAQDAAQAILDLRKKMGLKGDFSAVENLEEVRFLLFSACSA